MVVFWEEPEEWGNPPPDLGYGYHTGFGTLVGFSADGTIITLRCLLRRFFASGAVEFDLKSGYTVHSGIWEQEGGELKVAMHLRAREKVMPRIGESPLTLPGPKQTEEWALEPVGSLADVSEIETGSGELVPLKTLRDIQNFLSLFRRFARP